MIGERCLYIPALAVFSLWALASWRARRDRTIVSLMLATFMIAAGVAAFDLSWFGDAPAGGP